LERVAGTGRAVDQRQLLAELQRYRLAVLERAAGDPDAGLLGLEPGEHEHRVVLRERVLEREGLRIAVHGDGGVRHLLGGGLLARAAGGDATGSTGLGAAGGRSRRGA